MEPCRTDTSSKGRRPDRKPTSDPPPGAGEDVTVRVPLGARL
jgi:hypothetical protein